MDRRHSPAQSDSLGWLDSDRLSDAGARAEAPAEGPGLDDGRLVGSAAAAVGLSEFDLFRVAWQHWQGSTVDERKMEPVFVRYLYEQKAPTWVRQFARQVLAEAAEGTLDPAALGCAGFRRREPLPDLSCRPTAEVLVCILIVVLALLL